jgi:hypothetical protein
MSSGNVSEDSHVNMASADTLEANAMSGLIDSLIEEYYIPPIIFNLELAGDQIVRRVCVDGKQRLSSVHAFMEGKIPCHDKSGKPWSFFLCLWINRD